MNNLKKFFELYHMENNNNILDNLENLKKESKKQEKISPTILKILVLQGIP